MDADNIARMTYLVLLGAAVLMWFITQNRQNLGKTLQQALAWVFIFVGVLAVVGLWEDIRSTVSPSAQVVVTQNSVEVPRSKPPPIRNRPVSTRGSGRHRIPRARGRPRGPPPVPSARR